MPERTRLKRIKEMGLTPTVFARTLPNAVGHVPVLQEGLCFEVSYPDTPDRRVTITLTEQPERRIASICLPVTRVEIEFQGFDENQAQQFMKRFDLYYQKGGG